MRRQRTIITLTAMMVAMLFASQERAGVAVASVQDDSASTPAPDTVRFGMAAVWIDAGEHRLAAWQLECSANTSAVKIVGIEGGDHPQFRAPPYYDPAAMRQERVILAAFSTAQAHALPAGRTRVATIHFQQTGNPTPEFSVSNVIAADDRGQRLDVHVTIEMEPQS